MATARTQPRRWTSWTIQIKVWKLLLALAILPVLVMWYLVVHQDDEILALVRNEVTTGAAGERVWMGSFANTNDSTLRDVAVSVVFLDGQYRVLADVDGAAAELSRGEQIDLQLPLPPGATSLRVQSVQWRMGDRGALMGPFREAWEFGYLMTDPASLTR